MFYLWFELIFYNGVLLDVNIIVSLFVKFFSLEIYCVELVYISDIKVLIFF